MDFETRQKLKIVALLLLKKKILLQELQKTTERRVVKRTVSVRPCFVKRATEGFFHTAVKEMIISDECHFKVFLRMTPTKFNDLVRIVGPRIFKHNEEHHGAISVEERLCLSLRYGLSFLKINIDVSVSYFLTRFIASGDSVTSISFLFRVGKSTASQIIAECMEAIWDELSPQMFNFNEDTFPALATAYEKKWFMPNCIGAIDGKHIQIQVHL